MINLPYLVEVQNCKEIFTGWVTTSESTFDLLKSFSMSHLLDLHFSSFVGADGFLKKSSKSLVSDHSLTDCTLRVITNLRLEKTTVLLLA